VAGDVDLPVIVHIRDAFDDAFRLIEEVGVAAGGIVHCFTGGQRECARALELGMHISLSGIVTFKNAKALRQAVEMIPLDRLLVETDSPFLAPVPHRGQRNEPAFVVETTKVIAELRGDTVEGVAAAARANTIDIFGLPLTE
jgi:TatD DNase family protein